MAEFLNNVPDGWEVKTLGEVCEIARGGSPRPISKYLTEEEDGINWIKIGDATASDKYIHETKQRIKPEGISRSRLVKPGDFILSNSMSFGRPYIMKTTGCIHDGWLVLSDKIGCFNSDYLYHYLGSQSTFKQFDSLAAGSTVRNLNIDLVSKVVVALPSLTEQERIVGVLDEAFEGIATATAQAEKNLQNARELFQSVLQSTFSQKGDDWVETTLGECCELYQPKTISKNQMVDKGSYPVFGANGQIGNYDQYNHEEPQLLLTCRGATCGAVNISLPYSWINGNAMVVRPFRETELSFRFTEYFLRGCGQISGVITGSAQPQITRKTLSPLRITFPENNHLQGAIVEKLDALSEETKRLEAIYQRKLAALAELKQSLLQRAFTGQL